MIFKEIHIDGFGFFKDFSLPNLKKGINIILGNNEVGKSTLLEFLRYTLFGYPPRIYQKTTPINGGNHGGRIKGIHSSVKEVIFERFAGSRGGKFKLIYNKKPGNPNLWDDLLGNANVNFITMFMLFP